MLTSLFHQPKRPFPWVRLVIGIYLCVSATIALLRVLAMRQIGNPYIKPMAILMLVTGAALIGSGIWIAIDKRNPDLIQSEGHNQD